MDDHPAVGPTEEPAIDREAVTMGRDRGEDELTKRGRRREGPEAERDERREATDTRRRTQTAIVARRPRRGRSSRWPSTPGVPFRHGSAGAIAMKNNSATPIGTVKASKYGAPMLTTLPDIAWTKSGKTVPTRTTSANAPKRKLLTRKAPSRETAASMPPAERSWSPRHPMSTDDAEDHDTEEREQRRADARVREGVDRVIEPGRVRKVPRIVSAKVADQQREIPDPSSPRRSWTITECR